MKLLILMTVLMGLSANAEECSKVTEVCGCQTVCSNSGGFNSRQPFLGGQRNSANLELRYSPKSALSSRRPGSRPVVFCNSQDSRDCVTIYR